MILPKAEYFFVSDVHLKGSAGKTSSDDKETARFLEFLDSLPSSAKGLYLLGDIFDFWVDYKYVIPKGFTRVLGKLASLADSGLEVHFFPGNHDWWTFGYLETEIGMKVHYEPYVTEISGKRVFMAHGDGLGFKTVIDCLFKNKVCIALLKCLPSRWVFSFAHKWSAGSRNNTAKQSYVFQGEEDPLYKYAADYENNSQEKIDIFVFGHIHSPARIATPAGGELIILGDWQNNFEQAIFTL
ncbi:MAG: UDP-2,3-diacylglucosamine diphosphatase [Bacteroidales bacterium]|nr:UDP-2,3-diacylglucosamine diphosphatase [Bacteroidales bacterium]